MIKLAVRLSELRPIWRNLRGRGIQTLRQPGIARFSTFERTPTILEELKSLLGRQPKLTRHELNVPRNYPNPLSAWLHEAGHAMDPAVDVTLNSPRDRLIKEHLANRFVSRNLSPESYAQVRPGLERSWKSYRTATPLHTSLQETLGKVRNPLWETGTQKIEALPHDAQFPLVKSLRRQMARRNPEFGAKFREHSHNLQDLLKQKV